MKHLILILATLLAFSWGSDARAASGSADASSVDNLPAWVSSALVGDPAATSNDSTVQASTTYIACWAYDGQACSTPGGRFRCMWQPYEPGMCGCGSDYIWHCG